MKDHVELRSGAYADSVTLLQVSRQVQQLPGVTTAQVAMATPLNVEVLERMGFAVPDEATVNHLVVAVRLAEDGDLDAVTSVVYGTPKVARGLGFDDAPTDQVKADQKDFFRLLYNLLVDADRGPRLPTLVLALGPAKVRQLLGG